jgi:hypothetical protein
LFVIDDDQNHPLASDGTSEAISDGEEDHCPVTSEPCLTEDPKDYPESSARVTKGRFVYNIWCRI